MSALTLFYLFHYGEHQRRKKKNTWNGIGNGRVFLPNIFSSGPFLAEKKRTERNQMRNAVVCFSGRLLAWRGSALSRRQFIFVPRGAHFVWFFWPPIFPFLTSVYFRCPLDCLDSDSWWQSPREWKGSNMTADRFSVGHYAKHSFYSTAMRSQML